MKPYLLSLGVGLLVGLIYSLLDVRSPAPPVIALIGLLGMLLGEQIIPFGKHLLAGKQAAVAWHEAECGAHVFGPLPGRGAGGTAARPDGQKSGEGESS